MEEVVQYLANIQSILEMILVFVVFFFVWGVWKLIVSWFEFIFR